MARPNSHSKMRGSERTNRRGLLSAAMLVGFLLGLPGSDRAAWAQEGATIDRQRAYNVKGAYLYSFGRYVTWPDDAFAGPDAPFVIGILGNPPMSRILERIRKTKHVQGRTIEIRWFETPDEYEPCHILFLGQTMTAQQQQDALKRVSDSPVLSVGEVPRFTEWGGIVNFYISGGTVRFEINVPEARRRGLSIDAKLLSVAKLVGQ